MKLINSLEQKPNHCHLIGAYALGKCQRIIKTLRNLGYQDTIYLHGAHIKLCNLYENLGIDLGSLENASALDSKNFGGKLVLCPPGALHDRWSRRFGDLVVGYDDQEDD